MQIQLLIQKSSLQKQTQELGEANSLKDRLFSIISHDLRNPVAGLKAGLLLLSNQKRDQKDVTQFEQQVDFLQYTLDNVLYWSLSRQQAITVMQQLAVLDDIVEEVSESLSGLILQKHIYISITKSPATHLLDEQLLIIVLRNLLHNAIKYIPEFGRIELSTFADQKTIQVRIKDSGPGIDNSSDSIINRRKKGTGLGLSLSKELMKKNEGELEISSAPGEGTMVTLKWHSPAKEQRPKKLDINRSASDDGTSEIQRVSSQ